MISSTFYTLKCSCSCRYAVGEEEGEDERKGGDGD